MRINLQTTPNTKTVPFDNQQLLLGVMHKWLGDNHQHDDVSLYSFSWLQHAQAHSGGLEFPSGASWFINFYDKDLIKKCIEGIRQDPSMFHGLTVSQVQLQKPPEFPNKKTFHVASPVFVKHWNGEAIKHLTWKDNNANEVMTNTLATKLEQAN